MKKKQRPWGERFFRRFFYKYYSQNLLYELQIRARNEAVDYIQENMSDAMIWETQIDIMRHGISSSDINGLFLEFGVATGKSINLISSLVSKNVEVFGFDTFQGLPQNWSGHLAGKGQFAQKKIPKTNKNVTLIVGLFEDVLPKFILNNDKDASFIHIDCDLYASTKTILDNLDKKIKPGTIILFDEYFNYPSWKKHEFKAWQEFCLNKKITYRYLGYTSVGGTVLLQVKKRSVIK